MGDVQRMWAGSLHTVEPDRLLNGVYCREQVVFAKDYDRQMQLRAEAEANLVAADANVVRLRAALEKYGRHAHPNCHDLVGPSARVRHGCLCGLDAALAGAERGDVPASAPLTDDERALCEVIDERDTAHELLDRFAAAIGAMLGEEFGEHSSGNDPWANALEAIEA